MLPLHDAVDRRTRQEWNAARGFELAGEVEVDLRGWQRQRYRLAYMGHPRVSLQHGDDLESLFRQLATQVGIAIERSVFVAMEGTHEAPDGALAATALDLTSLLRDTDILTLSLFV